jgi:hypothetical protein
MDVALGSTLSRILATTLMVSTFGSLSSVGTVGPCLGMSLEIRAPLAFSPLGSMLRGSLALSCRTLSTSEPLPSSFLSSRRISTSRAQAAFSGTLPSGPAVRISVYCPGLVSRRTWVAPPSSMTTDVPISGRVPSGDRSSGGSSCGSRVCLVFLTTSACAPRTSSTESDSSSSLNFSIGWTASLADAMRSSFFCGVCSALLLLAAWNWKTYRSPSPTSGATIVLALATTRLRQVATGPPPVAPESCAGFCFCALAGAVLSGLTGAAVFRRGAGPFAIAFPSGLAGWTCGPRSSACSLFAIFRCRAVAARARVCSSSLRRGSLLSGSGGNASSDFLAAVFADLAAWGRFGLSSASASGRALFTAGGGVAGSPPRSVSWCLLASRSVSGGRTVDAGGRMSGSRSSPSASRSPASLLSKSSVCKARPGGSRFTSNGSFARFSSAATAASTNDRE